MSFLGIDKGGTRHTFALTTDKGEIVHRVQHETGRACGSCQMEDAQAEIEALHAVASELVQVAADRRAPVQSIGISFGGPVNAETGTTILSHHVSGWEGVPLRDLFEDWFGIRTRVDNDANVGCLGEWRFGAGRGCRDLLYVNIGTGIGGGIIANGQLVRGANNLAGEIGHTIIDSDSGVRPDGPPCTCGRRGCLESFASGPGIERRYHERFDQRLTCREIFINAMENDRDAAAIVEEAAHYLARGIGTAVSLLNPELVIVGGGVSEAGDSLFTPLYRLLQHYGFSQAGPVRVVPAQLGYDAGIIGAVALAMGTRQ
ncbi:MAG: hypothetical protein AUJ92_09065 [Armatimonadetes bacterium CG2_30_59_28]|nr:MAG: hypothetical protein AUJ92_09065 [Armatimonadetes bacterium CG2_30_59_28]PIY39075.1 MAG: hypothetical protein COZ05_19770 [Armatimonadetes bacterium CG_4_10_14_3_um_filter_59_10]